MNNRKYLNEEMVKELDELLPEHAPALLAYGLECVDQHNNVLIRELRTNCVIGAAIVGAVGIASIIVHKMCKEKNDSENMNKK